MDQANPGRTAIAAPLVAGRNGLWCVYVQIDLITGDHVKTGLMTVY